VPRVLSTAFCVALLAATAGAFALTQGAKVELIPSYKTHVDPRFSPTCKCSTDVAKIDFRLRKSDHLTVWITHDGTKVRTLVPGRTFKRGEVALEFDGRDDNGGRLPDGDYKPVVHLGHEHRTIEIPSTMVLDTKPPVVHVRHRIYTHISPDGDQHNDVFRIHYTVTEAAHGILFVDGHQVEFTRFEPLHGALVWNGKIGARQARPGNHVLEISAQDLAGNRAKPFPFAVVTVRYIRLGRTRLLVKPGSKFAVLVLTDAPTFDWLLHGGRGTARHGTLHLRAPKAPGVYRLYVQAAGHSAKALVVVG
jgi:hypothetical protein